MKRWQGEAYDAYMRPVPVGRAFPLCRSSRDFSSRPRQIPSAGKISRVSCKMA